MEKKASIRCSNTGALWALILFCFLTTLQAQNTGAGWPEITNTSKPWTRWWWMGNAVDREGIRKQLTAFQKAGLGGVEITPIYGVKGEEPNYLNFLSPQWMEMLTYAIATADSLGMQVDMILGTGWPYGGPQITPHHAATRLVVDEIRLRKGEKIRRKIGSSEEGNISKASLSHVLAFGDDGSYLDLTDQLNDYWLDWKAKDGNYTLYAVFAGKTGQQVKRAAPGGEGPVLDHYSREAFKVYIDLFDSAFALSGERPRAIFNDSYEVYGADYTPDFFAKFKKNRGYDLKLHLNLLMSPEDTEAANRVKSDYRETLAELLLTEFTQPWTQWAENSGVKTKLQAHGSPGNLLDLYAAADIPECETFGSMPYDIPGLRREKDEIREGESDPVMLKFSSSAAHLTGKPLVAAEAFTWLREHFKTALSHCKPQAEDLLLSGVNHIFLHGATYSPERASWPGWKFYASVNFSPYNTIWKDAPALFSYLANCQSLLQDSEPDNELLVYWPAHDVWDNFIGDTLLLPLSINSLEKWLIGTPFYTTSTKLMKNGYSIDFISDALLAKLDTVNHQLVAPGGSYKGLVVPDTDTMPLETLEKLIQLKKQGVPVFFEGLPESVPGFFRFRERNQELAGRLRENGEFLEPTGDIIRALTENSLAPETLVQSGLQFIRRKMGDDKLYFLVNHTSTDFLDSISLQVDAEAVVIFDPLTGLKGRAAIKRGANTTKVKVQIPSGGSLFLKTGEAPNIPVWDYFRITGKPVPISGSWKLSFLEGGPELPGDTLLTSLKSWTGLGTAGENFSGTARYEIEFKKPSIEADNWMLNLGDVRESARIWLNGKFLGTAWSVPFRLTTGPLQESNKLVIEVTNLAANRIRAKEQRGEEWKIFHEINMVNINYEPFDAASWKPMPSGLLGEISLSPLQSEE